MSGINLLTAVAALTGSITAHINARNATVIRSRVVERDGSLVVSSRAVDGLPTAAEIESASGINPGNLSKLLKSASDSDLVALMRIPLSTGKGGAFTAATVASLAAWAANAGVSTAAPKKGGTPADPNAESEGSESDAPVAPNHADEARDVPADVAEWLNSSTSVKMLNARISLLSDIAAQARAAFTAAA